MDDQQQLFNQKVKQRIHALDVNNKTWQNINNVVVESAEEVVGRVKPKRNGNDYDPEIEALSGNDIMKTVQMKQMRNKILKEIKSKLKYARECKIDRVIEEMGNTHDDAKMFSAIKRLKTNRKQNKAVHDEDGKNVTNEREKYGIIQKHFKHQFFDPTKTTLQPFEGAPAALINPITPEEIRACVKKMSNNKSPGDDEMTIEMVKYGPSELINEIANTLNSMLEQHDLRGTDIGNQC